MLEHSLVYLDLVDLLGELPIALFNVGNCLTQILISTSQLLTLLCLNDIALILLFEFLFLLGSLYG